MPIGKNAIKRVENNGYSKVESSAPDMENSTVIANIDQQVVEKIIAPVEKKAATKAKKAPAKKAVKKEALIVEKLTLPQPIVEAPVEVKAEEVAKPKRKYVRKAKVEEVPAKPKRKYVRKNVEKKAEDKFGRVEVGTQMPYYLL